MSAWRAVSHGSRAGTTVSAGSDRVAGVANARAVPNPITSRKSGSVDGGIGRHVDGDPDHHEGLGAERDRGQPPAVDAVGEGAGDEHQQGGGGELGETQEPEGELAVGHVEDELAQHGAEQRHRGRRREDRGEEGDDRARLARHRFAPHRPALLGLSLHRRNVLPRVPCPG